MQPRLRLLFRQVTIPLLFLSVVSGAFLLVRLFTTGSTLYWFLPWNLFLAWVPYLVGFGLVSLLRSRKWLSWQVIVAAILWLGFLPNTFYVVTDLIHIHHTGEVSVLFDVVMMSLFAFTGVLLGFVSLLLVQKELEKRLKPLHVYGVVAVVIVLSSLAIYLGRYLRWNTWDILVNPDGLLIDIVDRVTRPYDHPLTVTTTLMFSCFIAACYFGLIKFVRALQSIVK